MDERTTAPVHDLWYGTSGPQDAPVVLVGESWGAEEEKYGRPFIGTSGTDLDRILAAAGLDRSHILCSNVIAAKPQGNETWRFFLPRDLKQPRIGGLCPSPLVVSEVRRLYAQILAHPRRLVIAAGNFALWALSDVTGSHVLRESNNRKVDPSLQTWVPSGIMDWRGSMWFCKPRAEFVASNDQRAALQRIPLLPIIHPAAIQRAWYLREPTIHDLRARVPLALKQDWRGTYHFLAPPDYGQCIEQLDRWIQRADTERENLWLAGDVENLLPHRGNFITCWGIADSADHAMSIPFMKRAADGGYESWWTAEQEAQIIWRLRRLMRHPNVKMIGQYFIHDIQLAQWWWGFQPRCDFDTMLCQNVVFPGTPKALEYLSSLYCHYHWYWKEDHKEWDEKGTVEDLLGYNCLDCVRTWETAESQRILLKHLKMEGQMEFKMQINDLCLRMMNRGVLIDRAKRGPLAVQMMEAVNGIHEELLQIVPQDMVWPGHETPWYASPKQTAELFYDIFGFRVVNKRTTGSRTVGKEALGQLKRWYPEFTGLFDRLDIAGSAENTAAVLQVPLDPDGRMRCSYNPAGTETHRLASSKTPFGRGTNLQNLTKGEEDE